MRAALRKTMKRAGGWPGLGAVVLALALAGGCAPVAPPAGPGVALPAGFPAADYRRLAETGGAVYRIDAARSLAIIEVRRGGSLAFLGHDHVVASRSLRGYVAPALSRADFYLRLDELVVDDPALRAQAGFETRPSAEDIEATRRNMLEKVLHAADTPHVLIGVDGLRTDADGTRLAVLITLNGVQRALDIPARIELGDGRLRVSGGFTLAQQDFGIAPFTVLGGALQVQDALALRFDIEAARWAVAAPGRE